MKRIKPFLIICIVFSAISLQAGLIIKSTEKSKQMNVDMETTIYIDKDRLRMEISGTEDKQVIIFRGDKNVFWIINMDEESYTEMTQEDMQKLKAKMDDMQKMMTEQMKNMPEEQRKMMEQMMPSGMSGKKAAKTIYKKKASGQKVGKWSCDHYEGFKDGKKDSDMWTASWDQIGIQRGDVSAFNKMAEFFEAISQDAIDFMKIGSEEWEIEQGISGVPVKWIDYIDGKENSLGEMKEILKQDLKDSMFELPSGFEKENSPWEE